MIVITIVIILAAVALPQYQKTILSTREAVLRDDLFKMRSLLDQFAADKQSCHSRWKNLFPRNTCGNCQKIRLRVRQTGL
jgi:Tfp pilus assembly protein PilE